MPMGIGIHLWGYAIEQHRGFLGKLGVYPGGRIRCKKVHLGQVERL